MKTSIRIAAVSVVLGSWIGASTLVRAGDDTYVPDPKTYACRKAEQPIVVDGKLDEAAWKKAEPIKRFFHYPERTQPAPLPDGKVEVYTLYDKDYLYVGAKIKDRDLICNPKCKTQEKETMWLDGDVFEVFVMPEGSGTTYYELHLNPYNAIWDARIVSKDYMWSIIDPSLWNSGAKSAVVTDGTINVMDEDQGWTLEIAIPLSCYTSREDKPLSPKSGAEWRASFCLYEYAYQNDDCGNGSALQYISSSKLKALNYHLRGNYDKIKFE